MFAVLHRWQKGHDAAKGKKAESSREAFGRFVGRPVDYCDWSKASGHEHCIAVSLQAKSFYVYQNSTMDKIPLEDIRSIEVNYMDLIGGSLADRWAKCEEQARHSGLFFKLRSVEHPEFKFRTADKRLIEKWSEIWAQLQEGRLPATKGVRVAKAA